MSKRILYVFIFFVLAMLFMLCLMDDGSGENPVVDMVSVIDPSEQITFDPELWKEEKGWGYAHRNAMLQDLVTDPGIRKLTKMEILELLGEPTRINQQYLYYLVDQKRAFILPLHTKTLVIKFTPADSIEWMKIHE